MSEPLEELADAADEVADDQRRIADTARMMQRHRERGWPWTRVLDQQGSPGLVELLRRSGRHLRAVTAKFTHVIASELRAEGESHRKIAQRLGVTHQRVSALLNDQGGTRGREA